MNKYYKLLEKITNKGSFQENKKGSIYYLINESLKLSEDDLLKIFAEHKIAKTKLEAELQLYLQGIEETSQYNAIGVSWWDYCAPRLINSYPTYFKALNSLIHKINKELRPSKNYILFIGDTEKETNQLPCLSLMQFQIDKNELVITVYQRSADSNLGLPSDLYQVYLISKMINLPLKEVCFFIGNAHIYENNFPETKKLLANESYKFNLNV